MKIAAVRHPKMNRLMRSLGIPRSSAVGIMEMAWHWVGEYAPSGELTGLEDDLEAAVEWDGESGKLIIAMADAGFLDSVDGRVFVHDWSDHCPEYIHLRLARQTARFCDGSMPNMNRLSQKERAVLASKYGPCTEKGTPCTRKAHAVHTTTPNHDTPNHDTARALPKNSTTDHPSNRNGSGTPPPKGVGDERDADSLKFNRTKAAKAVYEVYPRKVGRQSALSAIERAIRRLSTEHKRTEQQAARFLYRRVVLYAGSPAGKPPPAGGNDFRPHPSTWMNQGRYDDDPAEWKKPNGDTPPDASNKLSPEALEALYAE